MKKLMVAALLLAAGLVEGNAMQGLSGYQWKNRVVLVFDDDTGRMADAQVEALTRNRAMLDERDIVVLRVAKAKVRVVHGGGAPPSPAQLPRAGGETGFALLLIGKDGGVKLRETRLTDPDDLFALIDSMPMRQAEQNRQD